MISYQRPLTLLALAALVVATATAAAATTTVAANDESPTSRRAMVALPGERPEDNLLLQVFPEAGAAFLEVGAATTGQRKKTVRKIGKDGKFIDTLINFGKKVIAVGKGVVKCGFRGKSSVNKDKEPLTFPHHLRSCNGAANGANAVKALAERHTCRVGDFLRVEDMCLTDALATYKSLSSGQKEMMGDVMGGWLAYDIGDVDILKGHKQCLSRFKTTAGTTVWESMTQGYRNIKKLWPSG